MLKISIVVPTYNSEKYIGECIDSILNQQHVEKEILIIDGQSTDRTIDAVLSKKSDAIKIVSESDAGVADALNKGFAMATGDIFCWLNSDDLYLDPYVLYRVQNLFTRKNVDAIYGNSSNINGEGNTIKLLYSWSMNLKDYQMGANLFTGSIFFKKNAWLKFEKFSTNNKIAFEYEFIDFLFSDSSIIYVNDFFAGLRQHPDTITERLGHLVNLETLKIRGAIFRPDILFNLRRIYSHSKDGTLMQVIFNSIFRK
jgi:glycosyltransferase involved in cell wall biosynthesis